MTKNKRNTHKFRSKDWIMDDTEEFRKKVEKETLKTHEDN